MPDKLIVKVKSTNPTMYGVWNVTKNKWEFKKEWGSKLDAERYTRAY